MNFLKKLKAGNQPLNNYDSELLHSKKQHNPIFTVLAAAIIAAIFVTLGVAIHYTDMNFTKEKEAYSSVKRDIIRDEAEENKFKKNTFQRQARPKTRARERREVLKNWQNETSWQNASDVLKKLKMVTKIRSRRYLPKELLHRYLSLIELIQEQNRHHINLTLAAKTFVESVVKHIDSYHNDKNSTKRGIEEDIEETSDEAYPKVPNDENEQMLEHEAKSLYSNAMNNEIKADINALTKINKVEADSSLVNITELHKDTNNGQPIILKSNHLNKSNENTSISQHENHRFIKGKENINLYTKSNITNQSVHLQLKGNNSINGHRIIENVNSTFSLADDTPHQKNPTKYIKSSFTKNEYTTRSTLTLKLSSQAVKSSEISITQIFSPANDINKSKVNQTEEDSKFSQYNNSEEQLQYTAKIYSEKQSITEAYKATHSSSLFQSTFTVSGINKYPAKIFQLQSAKPQTTNLPESVTLTQVGVQVTLTQVGVQFSEITQLKNPLPLLNLSTFDGTFITTQKGNISEKNDTRAILKQGRKITIIPTTLLSNSLLNLNQTTTAEKTSSRISQSKVKLHILPTKSFTARTELDNRTRNDKTNFITNLKTISLTVNGSSDDDDEDLKEFFEHVKIDNSSVIGMNLSDSDKNLTTEFSTVLIAPVASYSLNEISSHFRNKTIFSQKAKPTSSHIVSNSRNFTSVYNQQDNLETWTDNKTKIVHISDLFEVGEKEIVSLPTTNRTGNLERTSHVINQEHFTRMPTTNTDNLHHTIKNKYNDQDTIQNPTLMTYTDFTENSRGDFATENKLFKNTYKMNREQTQTHATERELTKSYENNLSKLAHNNITTNNTSTLQKLVDNTILLTTPSFLTSTLSTWQQVTNPITDLILNKEAKIKDQITKILTDSETQDTTTNVGPGVIKFLQQTLLHIDENAKLAVKSTHSTAINSAYSLDWTCRNDATDWSTAYIIGMSRFLQSHLISCKENEFLQKFRLSDNKDNFFPLFRYEYVCCSLSLVKT